jgi:hypothetical protein
MEIWQEFNETNDILEALSLKLPEVTEQYLKNHQRGQAEF